MTLYLTSKYIKKRNAWEYVEELESYYLHLFDKTQADLNCKKTK